MDDSTLIVFDKCYFKEILNNCIAKSTHTGTTSFDLNLIFFSSGFSIIILTDIMTFWLLQNTRKLSNTRKFLNLPTAKSNHKVESLTSICFFKDFSFIITLIGFCKTQEHFPKENFLIYNSQWLGGGEENLQF